MGGEEYAVLESWDTSHRFDASSQRGAARSFPAQRGLKYFQDTRPLLCLHQILPAQMISAHFGTACLALLL